MDSVARHIRVARASHVLATASSLSRTFLHRGHFGTEDRFGETSKPARETRALPGSCCNAFTLIELLVVMAISIILAGLVVATTGYVQEKGKRSRAEAEIAAMSAALESYKADNEIYPTSSETEALKANSTSDVSVYKDASRYLYIQLAGDEDGNPTTPNSGRNYMAGTLKPNMLSPNPPNAGTYIRDAFGDPYGYSTVKSSAPAGTDGYNPTFDLWSTGGETPPNPSNQTKWIKNW